MSAWALREEKVNLQITRSLARLELEQMEQFWSSSWRINQGRDAYESVDSDGNTAQDAHSWSDREERDGYEVRMQEMEARVNVPSHGQSTKDFLFDVIRGWLVLQRSGLLESSWTIVLGSTDNTVGRSRIVEALKQRWPEIASEIVTERCARTSKEKQTSGSRRCI